jgi:hypothetical protein
MKLSKNNLATLGGCLLLATLALVSVAQSQSHAWLMSSAVASMDSRSAYATDIENQLRQRGVDARVQLAGDARDVLQVEWTSARHSDIYSFVNSSVAENARQMGFGSIEILDGLQRWDYDLTRESMVWSTVQ